ncbi:PEPxxWA-CTERM sorting domain-containing protein [Sphingomonas sp. M1-B02]|uniref:PEPxxWA-CTERM sorting domain-containing protein n=1 Tax=Sphingomonas sp. M1-B02 TaxID=3114300 RepID=UPI0022401264|nr:PEPxxWA-CTERM sorting domain-containing protein [Sphingomonas sp. S6-11]UZK67722.1 PEPxxWA-CTERM sorting domain-containing protein [Sphingomonas sp. S6-11]
MIMAARETGPTAGAPDPLAELARRSPGGRADGAIYSTKPSKLLPAMLTGGIQRPTGERVLANIRRRPAAQLQPEGVDAGSNPFVDELSFREEQGPDIMAPGSTETGLIEIPLQEAILTGPGLGGASVIPSAGGPAVAGVLPGPMPTATPTFPTGPIAPPVSAVPEPTTWLTMMIGFFVIGGAMRRRRFSVRRRQPL